MDDYLGTVLEEGSTVDQETGKDGWVSMTSPQVISH